MALTRRQILAGMAASPLLAQQRTAPGFRRENGPKPRTTPAICLYSDQMMKVGYEEMGGLLKTLGFEGCDLMVQPGGHVTPEHADLDLERGVEAMTGSGIDVFSISTSFTSPANPTLRMGMEWGGEMGVPVFRPGDWKFGAAEPEQRLTEVLRDIGGLAAVARSVGISLALHNGAGDTVGSALWDTNMLIRGMDPHTIGYAFDPAYAAMPGPAAFATALRLALPRIKMIVARDGYWSKDEGAWKLVQCPLGEGMVDWQGFLAALARARFAGPISLQIGYPAKDELEAIRKDLEFLKKQRAAAWG
jgi:sugar phosphate isomerase/epimerase